MKLVDTFIKKASNCGIIDAAISLAKFKVEQSLEKTDGKKKSNVSIPKLDDALWAGKKKSNECVLILTEGDSAKASVMSGIKILGRERYGVFPLKGKIMNVRDKSANEVSKNEELKNLKSILGLRQNEKYITKESRNTLRYGKVMVLTDADYDGYHIKGLFLNYIHVYWPELLKSNDFVTFMSTPIIKATQKSGKKKEQMNFYFKAHYEAWKEEVDISKWDVKYYKGLGTSSKKEFEEYCSNPVINQYVWTNKAEDAIMTGFAKEKDSADKRKEWLKVYDPNLNIDTSQKEIPIEDHINKELKHFSTADNLRSIPHLCDGFKPAQRKILFSAFKRNLVKEIRVSQFAGYISEHANYHHGENSLQQTIVGMAQDFVGSNNINLLEPCGQFGTRLKGGKDAASARYIFTKLEKITNTIYNPDDFELFNQIEDDGQLVEPEWYLPVIPMVLVNGVDGIGTGYSTFIPNYNPIDIIDNIKRKIAGERQKRMVPWYKNFKGEIKKSNESNKFIVKGCYEIVKANVIKITELPIGVWTENYKEFLIKEKTKGFVKKYDDIGDDTTVHLVIEFVKPIKTEFKTMELFEKRMKLTQTLLTSNMHLFKYENGVNVITKFKDPRDIINEFYDLRIQYYAKRRKLLLNKLKKGMKIAENKCIFIMSKIQKKLKIEKRAVDDIHEQMENLGILRMEEIDETNGKGYDYLLNMGIKSLSLEKVEELQKELKKKTNEYSELKAKKPVDLWEEDLSIIF